MRCGGYEVGVGVRVTLGHKFWGPLCLNTSIFTKVQRGQVDNFLKVIVCLPCTMFHGCKIEKTTPLYAAILPAWLVVTLMHPVTGLTCKKISGCPLENHEAKFWLSEIFFGCLNENDEQKMNNCISCHCHSKRTFILNSLYFPVIFFFVCIKDE